MAGAMGLPTGLENVIQSLSKEHKVESWELMSHVQTDTTNMFIKFQKRNRQLPMLPAREVCNEIVAQWLDGAFN